jgi:hypothetical protein
MDGLNPPLLVTRHSRVWLSSIGGTRNVRPVASPSATKSIAHPWLARSNCAIGTAGLT